MCTKGCASQVQDCRAPLCIGLVLEQATAEGCLPTILRWQVGRLVILHHCCCRKTGSDPAACLLMPAFRLISEMGPVSRGQVQATSEPARQRTSPQHLLEIVAGRCAELAVVIFVKRSVQRLAFLPGGTAAGYTAPCGPVRHPRIGGSDRVRDTAMFIGYERVHLGSNKCQEHRTGLVPRHRMLHESHGFFRSLVFRRAWEQLNRWQSPRKADLAYLRILRLAAQTMESEVAAALELLLARPGPWHETDLEHLLQPQPIPVPPACVGPSALAAVRSAPLGGA
jgi:hypothetical protein